jgi:hypothetical protein
MCDRLGSDFPIGYVSLYDANLSAQTAKVSCLVAPELRNGFNALDCVLAILGFGFSQWPLRKVYYECNSVSARQFGSAITRGLMVEEARLTDYECFGDGEWADMIWLSTDRATFDAYMLRRVAEA